MIFVIIYIYIYIYIKSRIDYWLISNDLSYHISEIKIEPSVLTDHEVIYYYN